MVIPENTSSTGGTPKASIALPSTANTSHTSSAPCSHTNGNVMAWVTPSTGPKIPAVNSSLGLPGTTVNMGHVLDFLLTAAQLHRVAAATTEKVQSSGRLNKGACEVDSQGVRINTSTTVTTTCSTSTSTTTPAPFLPSASQTWAKLLANPAAGAQEQTLALLQMALQDGLLDSILPYMVSSLNLGVTPSLTPSQTMTSSNCIPTLFGGGGGRSRTPTPTNKQSKSTPGATPIPRL
ncbi:hypothetical protein SK128_015800 [Halocaridina rubra]|uniref:Uncharacterized protein n=1 Tax=Halocaridina rubra TaxID=373956 RepID=A0AAN8WP48_HALRR